MSKVVSVQDNQTAVLVDKQPTVIVTGMMGPQGPVGPTGATGQGLGIDEAVTSFDQLPETGTPGQTVFVQETGLIYVWSGQ